MNVFEEEIIDGEETEFEDNDLDKQFDFNIKDIQEGKAGVTNILGNKMRKEYFKQERYESRKRYNTQNNIAKIEIKNDKIQQDKQRKSLKNLKQLDEIIESENNLENYQMVEFVAKCKVQSKQNLKEELCYSSQEDELCESVQDLKQQSTLKDLQNHFNNQLEHNILQEIQELSFEQSQRVDFSIIKSVLNNKIDQKDSLIKTKNTNELPENQTMEEQINSLKIAKQIDKQTIKQQLIKSIFDKNLEQFKQTLEDINKYEYYDLINEIDDLGFTPLMVCTVIAEKNILTEQFIRLLLKQDADPRIRDFQQWSCLEESLVQENLSLAKLIFDKLVVQKLDQIKEEKRSLDEILNSMPDFYIELQCEFGSSYIPFLDKIAPQDTIKIWKYGRCVRLDTQFNGFDTNKNSKQHRSVLLNSMENKSSKSQNQVIQGANAFFVILNRESKQYFYPLQKLEHDEKIKLIKDLMNSEPTYGDLKIKNCKLKKKMNILGNQKKEVINGLQCFQYQVNLEFQYILIKKIRPFILEQIHNFEEYSVMGNSNRSQQMICSRKNSSKANQLQVNKQSLKKQTDIKQKENEQIQSKKLKVFISDQFGLKFEHFQPLISFLSKGNPILQNLNQILKENSIKQFLTNSGFPVKIQIPFSYTIEGKITFKNYKLLEFSEDDKHLFQIPENFTFKDRKEVQNTLQDKKNRMMVANFYLN